MSLTQSGTAKTAFLSELATQTQRWMAFRLAKACCSGSWPTAPILWLSCQSASGEFHSRLLWSQLYPTSASHIHGRQMYPEHKLRSWLAAQAADVGMVGNGGFVLAEALGEHTESGPAASASDSTFSTVASISGKSLNVLKSLSTRKSTVCCVDSAKLAVRSQLASHSFSHPNSMGCDSLHLQNSQSVPMHYGRPSSQLSSGSRCIF